MGGNFFKKIRKREQRSLINELCNCDCVEQNIPIVTCSEKTDCEDNPTREREMKYEA